MYHHQIGKFIYLLKHTVINISTIIKISN